jgi:hypothetical protein
MWNISTDFQRTLCILRTSNSELITRVYRNWCNKFGEGSGCLWWFCTSEMLFSSFENSPRLLPLRSSRWQRNQLCPAEQVSEISRQGIIHCRRRTFCVDQVFKVQVTLKIEILNGDYKISESFIFITSIYLPLHQLTFHQNC